MCAYYNHLSSFTEVFHEKINKKTIEYGIVKGFNKTLLIKTGLNGSIYGYQNKYLDIALRIRKKYGYTVIVSSNPAEIFLGNYFGRTKDRIKNAVDIAKEYGETNEIFFFGHSNGALMALEHAYKYPQIKKLILVNTPVCFDNLNFVNKKIQNYQDLTMVYGSLDNSNKYFTKLAKPPVIIDGEDHHFSKGKYDFCTIPEMFL